MNSAPAAGRVGLRHQSAGSRRNMPHPVLEVRGITKHFPGVVANRNIDLDLFPGEILAVLGENGAGKSTLMNIISGLHPPTSGSIRVGGRQLECRSPRDAIAAGIAMVHQHFQLVPTMTVLENIVLGAETTRRGVLDPATAERDVDELCQRFGGQLDINLQAMIDDLPVGMRQRVELVKALYREARILILDEPTAMLTPQETGSLFQIMRGLRNQGTGIIFITHKLKEVLDVADRIVVLRQGAVVGHERPGATTEQAMAAMMVGRVPAMTVPKTTVGAGPPILEVDNLTVHRDDGTTAVDRISFEVHQGEILGLAGVQGNGQTELIGALTGLHPVLSGTIRLNGRDTTHASARRIGREGGTGHIPEDRHAHGMVEGFSVAQNLVLNLCNRPPFTRWGLLRLAAIRAHAGRKVAGFDIRTTSLEQPLGSLSESNQQKLVAAREMRDGLQLLIANQPTRGVDAGSVEFIHDQIVQQRNTGRAILLVSYDLDEILALADRIAVMFEGRLIGLSPSAQVDRNRLGLLMAGIPA